MSHDQLATDLRTVKSKLLEAQQHHGTASTLIAEALGTLESCMLRLERDSQSAPAHPATAHQLGGELAAAALADDGDPQGHDISGGLFGPNVSAWLRKLAGSNHHQGPTMSMGLRAALENLLATGGAIAEASDQELQEAATDMKAPEIVRIQATAVMEARKAIRQFDIEQATAREQASRANATTRDLVTTLDQIAKAASATVCNPGWIAKHATAATQRAKDQPSEQA